MNTHPILFVHPEALKDLQADPTTAELLGLEPIDVVKDNTVTRSPLFEPTPPPNCWYLMYGTEVKLANGTEVKLANGTVWENWTKVRSWFYCPRGLPSRYIRLPESYRRRSAAEKMAKRIMEHGRWKKVKVVEGWDKGDRNVR